MIKIIEEKVRHPMRCRQACKFEIGDRPAAQPADHWEEIMSYRVSYIDTSPAQETGLEGAERTEIYPTEPAALARARELLDDMFCERIEVSRGSGESLSGVCLQLKLGLNKE
jgi:hypothetical protein